MSNENFMPIFLEYYKGVLDEDDYKIQKEKLREIGIHIEEYDKSKILMMSYGGLEDIVSIVINSSTLQFLLNSIVLPGIAYDIFKKSIIWIWNNVKGKKITKLYSGGKIEEEEVSFGLKIQCNKNNITMSLSGDYCDEDKNKCIDKAFDYLKDTQEKSAINDSTSRTWLRYDNNVKSWYEVDMLRELQRKTKKKEKSK